MELTAFQAMSSMSMQLWTLVDLAGPVMLLLGAQLVVAVVYTLLVVFNLMGRDYEAAVVCSGFSDFSLGRRRPRSPI